MNDVSNPNYNESKDETMKALWWHNLYMASLGRRANTNTNTQRCVSNPAMIKVSGKTMTMKVLWWYNLDKASLGRRANTNTNTNTNTQCVLQNDQSKDNDDERFVVAHFRQGLA